MSAKIKPNPEQPALPHLREVDLSDFMAADAAGIGYAFHPILPRRVVTLCTGHGGAGKSTAALTLMAHGACGEPWLGFHPDGAVRSLYASLEDPGDLVRYRLRRITEAFNLDPQRIAANLRVLDCSGGDASLAAETNDFGIRNLVTTHLFAELAESATGADVIVVDNASDAFSGNENERRGVRAFMRHLADLSRQHDAGLLLAHVDKASAKYGAQGNSYSGSTAWHNSARSRIALLAQDDGAVLLVHEKLNLGKVADPVRLAWNSRGVLVEARKEAATLDTSADTAAALAVMKAAEQAGIRVPTGTSGSATSGHAVQHLPELPEVFRDKEGRMRFHSALIHLARSGAITRATHKDRHRNTREHWELTQSAVQEAA